MRRSQPFARSLTLVVLAALTGCGDGTDAQALQGIRSGLNSPEQKLRTEAIIRLKSLIQKRPSLGDARLLLADQLVAEGDLLGAKAEYQRAIDNGAAADAVVPKLARAMLLTGQGGQVNVQYGNERLGNPKADADLKSVVAMARLAQGDVQGATAITDEALKAVPEHAGALLMQVRVAVKQGDLPKAASLADALLARHPHDAEALATRAELWLLQPTGRERAQQTFAQALEVDPKHVHALARMVSLALASGDVEGAKKYQRRLRQAGPKLLITEQQEATIAYSAGDYAAAREKFQWLLRVAPDNLVYLLLAGQNDMQLGAFIQAESMFSKALALQPKNDTARGMLARAQLRLGQVPRALLTLSPLLERPDVGADVLALAAEANLLNGNAKAADAMYARVAKLNPTDPQLRTTLATAALGREPDEWVFSQLRAISADDTGTAADLALVSTYLKRGLSNDALKALDAIERKRPKDPTQRLLRGQILVGKNDLLGARAAFDDALAVSPGNMKAVVALAALDLRDKKPDAAKQRIQALLKQQPKNTKAMLALAELSAGDPAQFAQRKKLLDSAVQADASDIDSRRALIALYLETGDRNAALVAAQAGVAAMPQSVDMLELLAWCQLRLGEISQALSAYGKIMTLAPRNPRGYAGAAELHLRSGDLDNARRTIERGLSAAPGNPEILAQSLVLALRKRRPDEAQAIARSVQRDRPNEATGWIFEAEVEASQQHWAAAATSYRKALDKSPPAGLLPKYLHVLKLDGRAAEARAYADAQLKANPNDLELLFYLADLAQREGDLKTARRLYEDLLQRKADHLLALNNLATVYMAQKQAGALPLARQAALLAPQQPAVLDTLAQALASEGNLGEAIVTQKQAVQQAPNLHEFRLNLAKLLLTKGEKAEAKQELIRLADLGKGYAKQTEVEALLATLGVTPSRR